jgi:CBS domain-containing protein
VLKVAAKAGGEAGQANRNQDGRVKWPTERCVIPLRSALSRRMEQDIPQMRAHQIMTKDVITVTPHTSIQDAANIMLRCHLSGLPVVDDDGSLIGIVSESDFLRRAETGTARKRSAILQFFAGAGKLANEFVHERGRKVEDVMTRDAVTVSEQTPLSELVELMEKHGIKRLPVMSGKVLVGIVTRSNLLQAVTSLTHEVPDPTADDDHIRNRIIRAVHAANWRPA